MCSIIGSYNKDTIYNLIALNAYRGQHSWSITYYDTTFNCIKSVTRGMGEIPKDLINIGMSEYCIVHMQAPTTSNKDMDTVHPAQINDNYLWHNGIIKADWVKKRKQEIELIEYPNSMNEWDTYLILRQYVLTKDLNNIDGTFACLMASDDKLYLFRNEIAPLFIDKYNSISSTRFEGAVLIKPNIVWEFLSFTNGLEETDIKFNTVENPYYGLDL